MKKILIISLTFITVFVSNAQDISTDSLSVNLDSLSNDSKLSDTGVKALSKQEKLDNYYHVKKGNILLNIMSSWANLRSIAEVEVLSNCKNPLKFNGVKDAEDASNEFDKKGFTSFSFEGEKVFDNLLNEIFNLYDGKHGTNGLALQTRADYLLTEDLDAINHLYIKLLDTEYGSDATILTDMILVQNVLEMLTSLKYRNKVCHFRYFTDSKNLFEKIKTQEVDSKGQVLKQSILDIWTPIFNKSNSQGIPGDKTIIVNLNKTRGMLEELSYVLVKRNKTY